ncbi:MAG: hypothetical protein AAGA85_19930, partial [Bacteroidota bacterium]
RVYLLTTRFMVSEDGGKTLRNGSEDQEVHGDFHGMWLDPNDKDRYYLGADKGISITHDHGNKFQLLDNLPIAQYYRIGFDYRDPYYVYGGLQDNGFYATASFTRDIRGILNDSNWKVHWGDGQHTATDPDDWRTVYTSAENGSLNLYDPLTHRIQRISPNAKNITNLTDYYPRSKWSDRPIRYNWSAPFQLSQSKTLYYGGNHLFKSNDKGGSWEIISPDLTTDAPEKTRRGASGGITLDNTGAEIHCTLTTVAISKLDENIIWAGADDGRLHVTRNGGDRWADIRKRIDGVPEGLWVSRIEASQHELGRAYVSFDGHRSDHNAPYVLTTDDFGKSWEPLMSNLPSTEVIRVVREDLVNPNLLFIGTETGVWASIDRGRSWFRLMGNMPTVSVYDLAIHPRDNALIAGSHGRSLFVMDHLHALQQLDNEVVASQAHLFEQPTATLWENVSRGGQRGHFWYAGENPDVIRGTSSLARARFDVDVPIYYFVGGKEVKEVTLRITGGGQQFTQTLKCSPGVQKYLWNREFDPAPYTEEEERVLESAMADLDTTRGSVLRFLSAYESAGDTIAIQRRLVDGFVDYMGLDPSLGVMKAGSGAYQVTLTVEDLSMTKNLRIRQDPILNE